MKLSKGFFLRVGISVAALAALIFLLRNKLGRAVDVFRHGLDWKWFVAALLIYILAMVLISLRLKLVFKVQQVRVSLLQALYLSCVSHFFNLFFPSAVGGDVAKGYLAYQYSGSKLGSLTGVVLDRLLGFVTIVAIALTTLGIYSSGLASPAVKRALFAASGLLLFCGAFFASRRFAKQFHFLSFLIPSAKWRERLAQLYAAIREYRNHKGILFNGLVISITAQVFFLSQNYLLAKALGIHVALAPFYLLMPLVTFASMAPSLSGLGVREAGFVFFFKSLIPAEQAFAVTLLYDLIFYGFSLCSGILFAFRGGLKPGVLENFTRTEKLPQPDLPAEVGSQA